jgi:hypothetical protein
MIAMIADRISIPAAPYMLAPKRSTENAGQAQEMVKSEWQRWGKVVSATHIQAD